MDPYSIAGNLRSVLGYQAEEADLSITNYIRTLPTPLSQEAMQLVFLFRSERKKTPSEL